ncbi:MAG: O-antigen ligase family protein [Actinomycetes bacterium]
MLDKRSKQILSSVILTAVVAVTLVMAPYTLIDPLNLPKLSTLAFFAIIALSLYVPVIKSLFDSGHKVLVSVLLLFVLQIFLVLFLSGANFGGQFYGTFGRNTGALAYLSLALLLLSTALVASKDFLMKFIRITLIIGAVLVFYGNLQYFGHEPFPFVNAYTVNAPIGTFGNPDFQSAFMGLIAVVAFTMALNKALKISVRTGLTLLGIASLIVVYETIAKQGYFSFIAGSGVVVILWLFMTKRSTLAKALSGVGIVGGGLVFLALINSGPLATLIYKGSLAARGYYWKAAFKMLVEHPFFGVGMDGFVDWYRRARPADYYKNEFFSFSNASHNVYLDIASSGGFPLILLYFAIVALVIFSIVKVVRRGNGFDVYFVAAVGAWVAYQVQSFVSINQIGLAIWGWVLSGLIIGYEVNTRTMETAVVPSTNNKNKSKRAKVAPEQLPLSTVISIFGGIMIAAIVAIPPYYVNASFYSAVKSGDIKAIQNAAYLKPLDERRLLHVATILRDNKLEAEAIDVVRDATRNYSDSFDLWQLWASIPTATPSDVAHAKAEMKRLDPLNPDI